MSNDDIKLCNDLKHKSLETEIEFLNLIGDTDKINRVAFGNFINMLSIKVFKTDVTKLYNVKSVLDINNIDVLLWIYNNIYIYFCSKYNIEPTYLRFIGMINISKDTFISWGKNPNNPHFEFVKIVKTNSERSLSDSMLNGNLMAYATLKCWHGWTETPQTIQVIGSGISATPEQIAEKYGKQELPQLINQDIVDNN